MRVLGETYAYADSCKYMSWEEFFTDYLVQKTQGSVYQYSKARLKEAYRTKGTLNKVIDVIPEQVRPV